MKVLHIEAGRHFYGGARQAGLLIGGLADAGVDNVLVCPPTQPLGRRLSCARVVPVPMGGDLDFGLGARLERLIRTESPDIVHVHSRRGADLFAGRAASRARVPAVLTRRVESREPARWLRLKCGPYDSVVAISSVVRAELERAGLDVARIELIPSAVDPVQIAPDPEARGRLIRRFRLADDSMIIAMAAQFVARKGHALLLDCLPSLRRRHPGLRVLLFGQGPKEARIRRLAVRRQVADIVTFCGFDSGLPGLLPGLDVFVHPATREGLGSVVLEAMGAGCAVVASAAGGLTDIIVDRHSGLLAAPDDPEAWVAALDGLLGNPEYRAGLGRNARERASREFSVGRMTAAYRTVYAGLRGARRAA